MREENLKFLRERIQVSFEKAGSVEPPSTEENFRRATSDEPTDLYRTSVSRRCQTIELRDVSAQFGAKLTVKFSCSQSDV